MAPVAKRRKMASTGSTSSNGMVASGTLNRMSPRRVARQRL